MDAEAAVDVLVRAARLKWVPRTGWLLRGVADPESVAEHSWGVVLMALVLAQGVDEPLDRGKLLAIAVLHDLPEVLLSDIPTPAWRHLSAGAKQRAEDKALTELLAILPEAETMRGWWREFDEGSSPEGRLVRDADRLEMLLQALLYEQARGAQLEEFWKASQEDAFFFPFSGAVYNALFQCRRG